MYQPLILQRLSKIVLAFHFGCKATCLPPSKQMHLKRWWSTKPEEKKIMGNFTAPTLSGDLVHKNLIEPSTVWTRILPCKITGWNLKITCCEKGKSNRNQTFIFGVPAVSSSGVCVCVFLSPEVWHIRPCKNDGTGRLRLLSLFWEGFVLSSGAFAIYVKFQWCTINLFRRWWTWMFHEVCKSLISGL